MKKRVLALFTLICMLMLLPVMPAGAAETKNLVKNGGFEEISESGAPTMWGISGGTFGTEATLEKGKDDTGNALQLKGEGSYFISQKITLHPGATYEVKFKHKTTEQLGVGAMVKIECVATDGTYLTPLVEKSMGGTTRDWKEFTETFTAPANASYAILMLRMLGGTVLYDDVELNEDLSTIETGEDGKLLIDVLKNGGFEEATASGINSWTTVGGAYGTEVTQSEDAYAGKNAVKLKSDSNVYINQTAQVTGDADGKLSFWYKREKAGSLMIKIEFATKDGTYLTPYEKGMPSGTGAWTEYADIIKIPQDAVKATVMLRIIGGGEALYDAVSFKFAFEKEQVTLAAVEEETETVKNPPLPGVENLVINGGFEEKSGNGTEGWSSWRGQWGEKVSVSDENVHAGKYALKVQTEETDYPFAMQEIENVIPGAQYRISTWVNVENGTGLRAQGLFKFEFYSENEINGEYAVGESFNSSSFYATSGKWVYFEQYFTTPDNCKMVAVYPRLYGTGKFYMDDVECYQTLEAPHFVLETDNYIYYSEWNEGYATVKVNTAVYPHLTESTVSFALLDGETVLKESTGVAAIDGIASFVFEVDMLAEKQKEYTLSAILYDESGAEVESKTTFMYRYDRPESLDENGNIIVDGEIFKPIMMYHLPGIDLERAAASGVNAIQMYKGIDGDWEKTLDAMEALGMKALIPLYFNMKPAGDPSNIASTINLVTKFKDHPAVLGWMIMDEAYYHDPYPERALMTSYKTIRDIDPVNVVFTMENSPDFYRKVGRFADILGIDPYPNGNGTELSVVEDCVRAAYEAVDYRKPVWAVLQAFDYGNYFPSDDEIRHMIYDSFFAGAKGFGYYCFEEAQPGKDLDETAIWNTLVEFYNNENADAFAAFSNGEYPVYNEGKTEDVWYKSYIKDGELYMVALCENMEGAEVQISLDDFEGKKLGAFTAEILYGGEGTVTGTDTIALTLRKGQAVVMKVTPVLSVDFSGYPTEKYLDIADYPWARKQISELREKGIVNDIAPFSFKPGTNITRGDFAMFLIRTLEITAESTENFADVDVNAPYAREVAIGRACGILKGIGENLFNPEAEISRQDLMVICARGMRYKKQLEEGVDVTFSDKDAIADYAVADIAAMVRANIVTGYEDGTIRPLGNTTRAEAAVIMNRINRWDKNT